MADHSERARLVAEVAELKGRRLVASTNSRFFGWAPKEQAAYDELSDRIALLQVQLAGLDEIK